MHLLVTIGFIGLNVNSPIAYTLYPIVSFNASYPIIPISIQLNGFHSVYVHQGSLEAS